MSPVPHRLFDSHGHSGAHASADLRALRAAGVSVIIEPSCLSRRRPHAPDVFEHQVRALIDGERARAARHGILHACGLGLGPAGVADIDLAIATLDVIHRLLEEEAVVAVGGIGLAAITAAEEYFLAAQMALALAHGLPVLLHVPAGDRGEATERSLAIVRECRFPTARVVIDHANEATVPLILDAGCWAGLSLASLAPQAPLVSPGSAARPAAEVLTRLLVHHGPERLLVGSGSGGPHGSGDPLALARATAVLAAAAVPRSVIETLFWSNPAAFFGQSGRLALGDLPTSTVADESGSGGPGSRVSAGEA